MNIAIDSIYFDILFITESIDATDNCTKGKYYLPSYEVTLIQT